MTQHMTQEEFEKQKQQRIDRAINMREKQIAYFNSVNSAIAKQKEGWDWDMFKNDRDKFIGLWQEFYLENIQLEEDNNEKPF